MPKKLKTRIDCDPYSKFRSYAGQHIMSNNVNPSDVDKLLTLKLPLFAGTRLSALCADIDQKADHFAETNADSALLEQFVKQTVDLYKMDESHGLRHARNAAYYTHLLLQQKNWSPRHKRLTILMAYFHDTVDSKYGAESNMDSLLVFARTHFGCTDAELQTIEFVLNHMSFSKRRSNLNAGEPEFSTADRQLIELTTLIAEADMLEAYNLERTMLYQSIKHAAEPEPNRTYLIGSWVRTMIEKRILLYVQSYFRTTEAKTIAQPLHDALSTYAEGFERFYSFDY